MFNNVQQQIFDNVKTTFGTKIDLTEGGNSYLFYSLFAKMIDLNNQYCQEQMDKLSVFSALGNDLSSLGYLLNFIRPYEPFILSQVKLTASPSTLIPAGLEISYTPFSEKLIFISKEDVTSDSNGDATVDFQYVGYNQQLGTVPADYSMVIESTQAPWNVVTSATSGPASTPEPTDDLSYRKSLQSIYQASGNGIDGNIQLLLDTQSFIDDAKVYVGTNPAGTTPINGKTNIYDLSYGQLLIIIKFNVTTNPIVAPTYYPAVYQTAAQIIYHHSNFPSNFFYDNSAFLNEKVVPAKLINGQTLDIAFYTAENTTLNIELEAPLNSVKLNSEQVASIKLDIQTYLDKLPIGGTVYFSDIVEFTAPSSFTLANLLINGTPETEFSAKPDEYFELGTFSVSYV